MYESKIIKKCIKNKLSAFANKNNFKFLKPTVLIRENDNLLQIINFDIINGHFNCDIAIQPLYIPVEYIILSVGNRLDKFNTKIPYIWGFEKTIDDLENDLEEVLYLLEKNAIKWFDDIYNIQDFIDLLKNKYPEYKLLRATEKTNIEFLGYSYLVLGEYNLAKDMFEIIVKENEKYSSNWALKDVEKFQKIINIIDNEPEVINKMIKENIEYTKEKLKLK